MNQEVELHGVPVGQSQRQRFWSVRTTALPTSPHAPLTRPRLHRFAKIDLLMPEPASKPPAAPAAASAPPSFESGLQQLEGIVKEMESGELPLERALELFESGMKLSEACRKQLEEAETRVEILMKRAGDVTPQPFRTEKS